MRELSPVEVRVIRSLVIKEYGAGSAFLDQLNTAYVDVRHMTGVGYYVDLRVLGNNARVDSINSELSEAHPTLLNPPCDLVGFTLFIREGYLSSFEGYTFGDVQWPDEMMENWVVLDAH
jgi:hypothetical protein